MLREVNNRAGVDKVYVRIRQECLCDVMSILKRRPHDWKVWEGGECYRIRDEGKVKG